MSLKSVATSAAIAAIAGAISVAGLCLIAWLAPGVASFLFEHPHFAWAMFWLVTVSSVVARRRLVLHGG